MSFRNNKPLTEKTVMDSIPEVTTEKDIGAVLGEAKKFSGSTIGEAARRLESAVLRPCFKGNKEDAIKKGLIIPNEKLCVKCHNSESPTFKSFDYKIYVAKIAHNNPK